MTGLFFVLMLRLFAPLTIFKWPLLGGLFSIFVDVIDRNIMDFFGWGTFDFKYYHLGDKTLDMYYLFYEFLILLYWNDIVARKIGVALFIWRFLGFLAFVLTGYQPILFFAPNIFEFFFLFVLIHKKYIQLISLSTVCFYGWYYSAC
jgi:hypothetical protein